jgi:hypothetical protein
MRKIIIKSPEKFKRLQEGEILYNNLGFKTDAVNYIAKSENGENFIEVSEDTFERITDNYIFVCDVHTPVLRLECTPTEMI